MARVTCPGVPWNKRPPKRRIDATVRYADTVQLASLSGRSITACPGVPWVAALIECHFQPGLLVFRFFLIHRARVSILTAAELRFVFRSKTA